MKKSSKLCLILVCVVGMFFCGIVLLSVGGVIFIGNHGVSVDSNGNIYIGLDSQIRVVDATGQNLRTISPQTSKGYSFSIQNDYLLVDNYVNLYTLNLYGEVLSKEPSPGSKHPYAQQNEFQIGNRRYYIRRSDLFYKIWIEQDGKTVLVYRTAVIDMVATWSLLLLAPVWAALVVKTIKIFKSLWTAR